MAFSSRDKGNMGIWKCRDREISYAEKMLVMGILNVTPDSFSDGGCFYTPEEASRRALEIERDGADIIDIGAESTRPGSESISADQELSRLIPALKIITERVKIPISVDTYKSKTAREALRFGASIINDVWGLRKDPQMAEVVAESGAGMVLMANYTDPKIFARSEKGIVDDCLRYFEGSAELAIQAGIDPASLIFDPGIGFGTDTKEAMALLKAIPVMQDAGYPILIGHSRKRFIGELMGGIPTEERDAATLGVSFYCRKQNAACIRVHNVKDTVGVFHIVGELEGENRG